jgi:hypothetical protein
MGGDQTGCRFLLLEVPDRERDGCHSTVAEVRSDLTLGEGANYSAVGFGSQAACITLKTPIVESMSDIAILRQLTRSEVTKDMGVSVSCSNGGRFYR